MEEAHVREALLLRCRRDSSLGEVASEATPEVRARVSPDHSGSADHCRRLAGLPGMTPVRLAKLLDGFHPVLAWKAVQAGAHPADPRRKFAAPARTTDLAEVGDRYQRAGVEVLLPDMEGYPSMLVGDPGAPAVLFALGDPGVLEARPRVAIVGTRSATHYGRQVASELARDLAAEGVVVVSGLARGIDGAAHAGALRAGCAESAPPVAVVGTGLDVVYPPSNRELWEQVAARGAVLSESALGTKPHPGVFPARNRIIAALSDVVVVVESHRNGGSLYTADAAARRSIPVCAVPGSVRSRASDGTNALLVDGCTPVRDAADVLVAISLARTGVGRAAPRRPTHPAVSWTVPVDQGSMDEAGPDHVADTVRPDRTERPCQALSNRLASSRPELGPIEPDARRAVLDAIDDVPHPVRDDPDPDRTLDRGSSGGLRPLVERGSVISGAGWWSRNQKRAVPGPASRWLGDLRRSGMSPAASRSMDDDTGLGDGADEMAGAVQLASFVSAPYQVLPPVAFHTNQQVPSVDRLARVMLPPLDCRRPLHPRRWRVVAAHHLTVTTVAFGGDRTGGSSDLPPGTLGRCYPRPRPCSACGSWSRDRTQM